MDPKWGTDAWSFLVKDDLNGGTGTYNGLNFALSGPAGAASGNWTLTATDPDLNTLPNLPTSLDFLVVLKAGPGFGLWLLDDIIVDGTDSGTWISHIKNKGGNIADLSHLTIYVRDGVKGQNEIPEPGILALLGLGLAGLGFSRRRQA